MNEPLRPAWVDIDLDVIRANAAFLKQLVGPAEFCAVVKADGYGHGSVPVAKAALEGGATWLAVALVEEGLALRANGITAPILLLSEPRPQAMHYVVVRDLTPTIYTPAGAQAISAAAREDGRKAFPVHVKVDTGMHRVGAKPDETSAIIDFIENDERLAWTGLWTHFANADQPTSGFTAAQAERFDVLSEKLAARHDLPALVHSANSAATLDHPEQRRAMVRCGAALYGIDPAPSCPVPDGLKPAMSVKARVSFAKQLEAGDALSYGQKYQLSEPSRIATIPVGYADGVPQRLGAAGAEVLIGGRRRKVAGSVTMDQLMADCESDEVQAEDEVVLIGRQGDEQVKASEWARHIESISYEVICRIGPRLPRRYLGDSMSS